MINNKNKQRPKFLNLLQIRMPITAVASILHRITGVILILALPVTIYGLGLSLQGKDDFEYILLLIKSPAGQLLLAFIITSIFYHFLAGVRFLLLDVDIGYSLIVARWSAGIVILMSAITMILVMVGVFNS